MSESDDSVDAGLDRRVRLPDAPSLHREVTCVRSLAWRVDLALFDRWDALVAELCARGMSRAAAIPGLLRTVTGEGHEMVFVPRSGRVQIRVHYTVPEEDRRRTAERLYVLLIAAWASVRSVQGPRESA